MIFPLTFHRRTPEPPVVQPPAPLPEPELAPTETLAEELYRQLGPLTYADERLGFPLLRYVSGLAQLLQDCDEIVRDWNILFDIDRIPAIGLPWLGQFVGITIDGSLDESQQRQQLRSKIGWQRGTVEAIRQLMRPYLTGTKTIDIIERDPDPYAFSIITYSDESPPETTYADIFAGSATYADLSTLYGTYEAIWATDVRERLRELIRINKPAGLNFSYTVAPGSPGSFTIYQTVFIHFANYAAIRQAFQTYENLYVGA